jgi:hypothetical protein
MEIFMKKLFFEPKTILATGIIAIGLICGLSFVNYNMNSSQSSLHKANSGVGICFQRVTQTFTALMIRDFGSNYLSQNFRNITSECLGEVTKALSTLGVQKNVLKVSNNLKSDLHWFDQKVDKVSQMAQKDEIDISQSNVTNKYYELEGMKTSLEESLVSDIDRVEANKNLGLAGIALSLITLILSGVAFFFSRRLDRAELDNIELIASERIAEGELNSTITDLSHQAFINLNMPNIATALETFCTELVRENKSLEASLLKMNTIGDERIEINLEPQNREVSDFNQAFNTVLDKMQEKVFKHGILLDTDLNDNFKVYATNEELEQFLYSLLSYSMDCTLGSEENKKVTVRSKSLGGIAYCKVKVANYAFSDDEMGVLNGKAPSSDTSVNLLLLRELIGDLNASIAIKNKQNSLTHAVESEMEIIFDRAREEVTSNELKAAVNIVKGSKQEIKEYFKQNMSSIN